MRAFLKHFDVVDSMLFACIDDGMIATILRELGINCVIDDWGLQNLDDEGKRVDVRMLAPIMRRYGIDIETAAVIIFEAHNYQGPDSWIYLPSIVTYLNRYVYNNIASTPKERRMIANRAKRMILD